MLNKTEQANFKALQDEMRTNDQGVAYAPAKFAQRLADEGLVEVNMSITNADGFVAIRASQNASQATQAELQQAADAPTFELQDDVPLVGSERGRRPGGSKYPFDAMQVGQSFFVPGATTKNLGSSINLANRRYATETGEFKTTAKGNSVPVLAFTRKYTGRAVTENGVAGVRVWRTA